MKNKNYSSKVAWNEQFKVRVRRNASLKHEVIKLSIVLNLLDKYKSNLYWIRIYTEYPVTNGKICDVYFENIKTNEIIAYEIQKDISEKWIKETTKIYENWDKVYFKTDWVLIRELDFSDDIKEISDKIKQIII